MTFTSHTRGWIRRRYNSSSDIFRRHANFDNDCHTRTHARTHERARSHTHTHTRTHERAHTHTHTHARTHTTQPQPHPNTRTPYTHAYTRHTHTHTQTPRNQNIHAAARNYPPLTTDPRLNATKRKQNRLSMSLARRTIFCFSSTDTDFLWIGFFLSFFLSFSLSLDLSLSLARNPHRHFTGWTTDKQTH